MIFVDTKQVVFTIWSKSSTFFGKASRRVRCCWHRNWHMGVGRGFWPP